MEALVTAIASGEFDVKLTPQSSDTPEEGAALARHSLDKRFHGELDGTGAGEMLSAGSSIKGSASYVAIERVSGTLHGRLGTFALQHLGIMRRGEASLTITVVPDSGTGALAGISGSMSIEITGGKHFYRFEYSLPDAG
jgi:hypothetical protein